MSAGSTADDRSCARIGDIPSWSDRGAAGSTADDRSCARIGDIPSWSDRDFDGPGAGASVTVANAIAQPIGPRMLPAVAQGQTAPAGQRRIVPCAPAT